MSADVADLIFVRLAHIEDKEILLRIQPPLQLFHLNFRNSISHRFFLPANAAKLVVVYQLRHCRMRAANRALRILAQLEFTEFHPERVNQQQPSNERFAHSKNQLDHFSSLHHADQPGENAEHSAFRARRHQPRWWRLRIETAVAWAILRRENAGLPFKPENRSVDVRLPCKHARVIHQVARGKVIRTVGNDVEVAKEFERILAAQPHVELLKI